MSVMLAIVQLLAPLVMLSILVGATVAAGWLLWDTTVGPTAQDVAARRREGGASR